MNPKQTKTIYQLKLHETVVEQIWNKYQAQITGYLYITRVPGGWLYRRADPNKGCSDQTVFVPFNNEFMCPEKE
jgi:hypothetical protein